MLYYECRDDVVKWAKGCDNKDWIYPYDGNGKFPWKVEWAAKWPSKGVIIETAGKDHFTKGGSRTIACRISVDVFDSVVTTGTVFVPSGAAELLGFSSLKINELSISSIKC